jgi:hypothetical protein
LKGKVIIPIEKAIVELVERENYITIHIYVFDTIQIDLHFKDTYKEVAEEVFNEIQMSVITKKSTIIDLTKYEKEKVYYSVVFNSIT